MQGGGTHENRNSSTQPFLTKFICCLSCAGICMEFNSFLSCQAMEAEFVFCFFFFFFKSKR